MNNFIHYKTGFRLTLERYKIVIILWLANFVAALIVIYPLYSLLSGAVSNSLMNDLMLNEINLLWLGDLTYKLSDIGRIFTSSLLLPVLVYLLLQIFFNGGMIAGINENPKSISTGWFMGKCAFYFGRFFRLFLFSIPVYLLMFILFGLVGTVLELFVENASTEWPGIITANIKWFLFVILFTVFNMMLDYAKLRLVFSDSATAWRSLLYGIQFAFKRFFKAWGLYLLNMTGFIIFTLVYMEIEHALPGDSLFFIIIVFILQQLYIWGRMFLRMNFFASQNELYRLHS